MISPCHECTRRTAVPNCHSTCDLYAKYSEYRENMRIKRELSRTGDDARIRQLVRHKRDLFKSRKK